MVLALHLYQRHLAAQQLQGCEHLQTLDDGHVRVGIAVQQQQRRVNLVGIEQGRSVDVELAVAPGIAVGHGHLAVVVAPVALAPVAGVVGDACMADGCCKDVGDGLQVLRHEASVGGAHAADLRLVDEGVLGTYLPHALYDVAGRCAALRRDAVAGSAAGGVHMARGPLLSEAGGAAGLEDVGHVAQRVPVLRSVGRLKIARHGRTAAVVVDDHGILLRGVEVLRQIEPSVDGVALAVGEVPVLAGAQLGVAEGALAVEEGVRICHFHLAQRQHVGRGGLHGGVAQIGQRGCVVGYGEAVGVVALCVELRDGAGLQVEHVQTDVVAVFGREVDHAVGGRAEEVLHRGVEVARQRFHGLGSDVVEEELVLDHAGRDVGRQLASHAVEGLWIAHEDDLPSVGREAASDDVLGGRHEGVDLQRVGIDDVEVGDGRRPSLEARARDADEELRAVGSYVLQVLAVAPEGDTLAEPGCQVVAHQVVAAAPAGLTVVHLEHLVDLLVLLRPFVLCGEDEVVLRGADVVVALWNVAGPRRAFARRGVYLVEHALRALPPLFNVGYRAGQPLHALRGPTDQGAAPGVAQLVLPPTLSAPLGGLIGQRDVGAVGRQGYVAHPAPVGQVVHHVGMAAVEGVAYVAVGIEGDAERVAVAGLSHVLDGHGVVVGGEAELRGCLGAVDVDLVGLRALHLEGGLQVVAIINI